MKYFTFFLNLFNCSLHYNTCQFGLAMFQVLSSHIGVVVVVLGCMSRYNFYLALGFA